MKRLFMNRYLVLVSSLSIAVCTFVASGLAVRAAACTAPSTDYGTVTLSGAQGVSLAAGTYHVWTRMAAADTTNNTFLLETDGSTCNTVGGAGVPVYSAADDSANTRFKNDTSNWKKVDVTLGTVANNLHTVKLIGNAPNVVVDRIIFLASTDSCAPSGTGDNCTTPPDVTPPVANITSPANNANVASPITVAVNATDDSGSVTKVELYVDGAATPVATDSSSPYSLNSGALAAGTHTLQAKAYDAAGNTGVTSQITVTVSDTTPPTVSVTQPANNSNVAATIVMSATANDNIGVSKVEFLVNGTVKATDSAAPYSASLDTTTLANGTYSLTAKAYDAANNSTPSSPVTITVNNPTTPPSDNTAPTVTISNPAVITAGVKPVIAGKAVQVSVDAADPESGVQQVTVKVNGVTKATLTTAPYTYSLDTRTYAPGAYTLTVEATNKAATPRTATSNLAINISDIADLNGSCSVSFGDISLIIPRLNNASMYVAKYDINNNGDGDGRITFGDISAIVPKLLTNPCTP